MGEQGRGGTDGSGKAVRLALRIAIAIALLALAIWAAGPARIEKQLQQVALPWFLAALGVMALSQWVSVWRWESIARIFGLRVQRRALALAYAQGMTVNVLLPGATLGGDTLRSVRLQALGNPLGVSALTVLLDRLSGLWVLCVLSLLTGGVLAALWFVQGGATGEELVRADALPQGISGMASKSVFLAYLAALAVACALPWLPLRLPHASGGHESDSRPRVLVRRIWRRICGLHDLALAERNALGRSLWMSILVQFLCAVTLWLCLRAVGGSAQYWQVQAVAAPIFVAGALPLSYGGFGAREITALIAFPLVGLPAEAGLAASALYGIVAIVLGLAAAPSFSLRYQP
jgi:uncharacterized membrane protein YbhN (UPF0104 family)